MKKGAKKVYISMFKKSKVLIILLLLIFISISIPSISYGNSAEPPSILIIVPDAPDDLEISIGDGNAFTKAGKTDKIIETYYTFYSRELEKAADYTFNISTGDIDYEITLEKPLRMYSNIYTLDLEAQTLIPGRLLSRSILLVSMRIVSTIIIEAVVFMIFGFREQRSWSTFLIINLLTQGALNIWINGFFPISSYLIFSLIFAEIIVFIVETLLFLRLIREHSKLRRILYVFVANLLSLIAGGYIITILPI